MMQAPADTESQSTLLQQLSRMGLSAGKVSATPNLAESLADLIDLSESISLARTLTSLGSIKPAESNTFESPQRQFLNTRAGIVRLIKDCFSPPDTGATYVLPAPNEETLSNPAEGVKPYQRFYSLLQSEMDHRIGRLRKTLRGSVATEDPTLSKLTILDRIIDDVLCEHTRKVLAVLPRLLTESFNAHRGAFLVANGSTDGQKPAYTQETSKPAEWSKPDGWLYNFQQDMRQLMLAEMDFRLLPARALLDALDTQD